MSFKSAFTVLLNMVIWQVNALGDPPPVKICTIAEEPPKTALPFFIYPNELSAQYLRDVLANKTGVLISVGTFRTLFNASMGNFSNVFMLDNDSNITRFNIANLALIDALSKTNWPLIKQRLIYVAMLTLRQFLVDEVDQFIPIAEQSMRSAISAMLTALRGRKPLSVSTDFSEMGFTGQAAHAAKKFVEGADDNGDVNRLFEVEDMNGKNIEMTYWRSDESYQKIIHLIEQGRIRVVSGDITGKRALASIAECVHKIGENVSIFDVSNAIEYFLEDDAEMKNFGDNIESLVLPGAQMQIISTVKLKSASWRYLLFSREVLPHWQRVLKKIVRQRKITRYGDVGHRTINRRVFEFFVN